MQRPLAALAASLLLLAGCGSDPSAGPSASSTTDATTAAAPDQIVSLSATATEMLFAIGAGDQVVAVDSYSNYPPEAPTTDLSAYEPNIEAIAGYEPDLVVVDGTDADLVAGLEALDIDVLEAPAALTLDDTYDQIAELGEVTGNVDGAADVVDEMQAGIDALLADLPAREEPLSYFHELDSTLFSVSSKTFIGQLYALAGLQNVADAADADGQAGGYPQVSAEYLVAADPDLVFLADTKCCGQTPATFAARPGFGGLRAVTAGRVIELDDDIASRWGPRVVDLLGEIVDAVRAVPAG